MLSKKERFLDPRNIAVAHVGDDDLGRAFGVKAFYQAQLKEFIKQHLISLTESDNEDKDKSETITDEVEKHLISLLESDSEDKDKSETITDEDSSGCEGCENCRSNDNYYQSELEIASSEEEERPPQVQVVVFISLHCYFSYT